MIRAIVRRRRERHGACRSRRHRWATLAVVITLLGLQAVLTSPAAHADGPCAEPPAIDSFNGGLVGAVDPTTSKGFAGTAYNKYGYGGMVWHTYDVGDRITCSDAHADINNWAGGAFFDVAKAMVGVTNALHYQAYEGGLGSELDDAVRIGSEATYQGVAVPFLPIALLILAIVLFKFVFAGKLKDVVGGVGRTLIGVTFVAATAFSPMIYSTLADDLLFGGIKEIDSHMTRALYGDTVARHVLPSTLHEQVVYNNWLRGEFGDHTSRQAQELGPKLLDSQAFSWAEIRDGRDGDQAVVDAKKKAYTDVAKKLESTSSYSTFTGEDGSRFGTGALAATEAALFTPLQAVSKLAYLFAQLVLRMAVLFGPLLGMLMLVSGVARTVLRGVGGVLVFGLVFWAVSNVHTLLLREILESGMPLAGKLALMFLITVLIWAVVRPVKQIRAMTYSAMHAKPGQGMREAFEWMHRRRMMRLMRKGLRRRGNEGRWWNERGPATGSAQPTAGAAPGAEDSASTIWAHASRPEAAKAAASGSLPTGTGGSRGAGTGTSGAAGSPPPPPPRGPRGNSPAGYGGFFVQPGAGPGDWSTAGTVRAEATRLWEPNGTSYRPGLGGSAGGEALPGEARHHELPAGQWERDTAAEHDVDGGDVEDRRDLVRPTEIYGQDDPAAPPRPVREVRPHDDNGKPVYEVYKPSANEVVSDPSASTSTGQQTRRPEAQPDRHRTDDSGPEGDES